MKYIETTIRHLSAITREDTRIVQTPEPGGIAFLQIGEERITPFVGWMRYDTTKDEWVELSEAQEEQLVKTLTEDRTYRELTGREAGEQFSTDIELY